MERKFWKLLGVILVGVLVVSIFAGCGNNSQVSNSSGQPAKTEDLSPTKQGTKDPNPIDSNKAVKELGIFKDKKIWENAKIGGDNWSATEIFFNTPAGEKIIFPFDVVVKYWNAFDSGSVVDYSTNIKKETSLDVLNILALRPQSDGTLKLQEVVKIVVSWPLSGMKKNEEIMIPAGKAVVTVPKTSPYMTKHVGTEVTNKANIGVSLCGTDPSSKFIYGYDQIMTISKNILSEEAYRTYLESWLKYDKNMSVGDGEEKD